MRMKIKWIVFALTFVFISMIPLSTLHIRADTITISVVVPAYLKSALSSGMITEFETSHPNIKINVSSEIEQPFSAPAGSAHFDEYLKNVGDLVSHADVLFVDAEKVTPESTRAGNFLNLMPLVSADASLNAGDFIPAAWQSYQWDGGFWALPISVDPVLLAYQPKAFDKAGLSYPTEKWALTDLSNATRALNLQDANGKIVFPGFYAADLIPLHRSLLNQGLYDPAALTSTPQIAKPAAAALLSAWQDFDNENNALSAAGNILFVSDTNISQIPIQIGTSSALLSEPGAPGFRLSRMPGGNTVLRVNAFALSGATLYPDQAYEFAKFLSTQASIASSILSYAPARKSLNNKIHPANYTLEQIAVLDDALINALPSSELRFFGYFEAALDAVNHGNKDAQQALLDAQQQAFSNLQTAAGHAATILSVATPIPTLNPNLALTVIKFGVASRSLPLPNEQAWQQAIRDFTTHNPQIGQIIFDESHSFSLSTLSDSYDCFYVPGIQGVDTETKALLNLDPLLSADKSFSKADFVGGTFDRFQQNSKIWAYPIDVQPQVLRYNIALFDKAGIPLPTQSLTIDTFLDALKRLKAQGVDSPFQPSESGGSYLLMLIAAYGGLPLDYRTTPITINFTDPATQDAIRQVLDLAKNGYIKYRKLTGQVPMLTATIPKAALYNTTVDSLTFPRDGSTEQDKNYGVVNFPLGSKYIPLAFNIGAVYISAKASNPDACYQWIVSISKNALLISGMPARRLLLDSSLLPVQSDEELAFYKAYDALMTESNVVIFPMPIPAGASSLYSDILSYWLYRAFDNYVLDSADLNVELKNAEVLAKGFEQCASTFQGGGQEAGRQWFNQIATCAAKVDPAIKSFLGT